jgi:hypothetical protein
MATVTNRVAQSACPGQSVRVTLDTTDSAVLDDLTEGQLVTTAGSKTGNIVSIDIYGNSFLVTPTYPFSSFNSSSNPEGLAVGEVITY